MQRSIRPVFATVVATAVVTAAMAGCEPEGSRPSGDEAPGASPFEIDPVPSLSVGVLEGDTMEQFDGVVDAFLMPNGDLAVATRGGGAVRIFGPDGSFVESLGRPGQGPGEFATLRSAWARGDTVEAWDSRARRITRFPPGGEPEVVGLGDGSLPLDAGVGPVPGGWVVGSTGFGEERDRMGAHFFSRQGSHEAEIVELPGMERHQVPGMSGPHPLTPTALFDVHGGELYAAEALTPVITVHDASGSVVRELRLELPAAGPPDAVFGQVVDSAVARVEEDRRAETRARLSAFPVPDRLPLLWDFIVDDEGLVWVRPFDPFAHALALGGSPGGRGGPGGTWLVVSADGAELGRVAMPADLEPTQVTADAVVGIHRDELGVESVRVHALHRR